MKKIEWKKLRNLSIQNLKNIPNSKNVFVTKLVKAYGSNMNSSLPLNF